MGLKTKPIAVDLFSGAGGMTLGFEQAGFDVLASVEVDPIHCAVHKFNFPHWSMICQSVVDVSGLNIRTGSAIQQQEIDVVFGGSPCQGFSLIGRRALDDPRNSLVTHFMRLVTELEPKYFVLENVKGLTVGRHSQFLEEVILAFQVRGYRVREDYRVLNAVNYGVPQTRERLFLLGCRGDMPLPEYPVPVTRLPQANRSLLLTHLPSAPTVWEAIADLPEVEQYPELLQKESCLAEYGAPLGAYGEVMRGWHPGTGDYSYTRSWNPQMLTSSLRTLHREPSIQRFRETAVGAVEPISRFFRLDPNGVCNTLRAGTASNRGSFTSPRPIHPFLARCITVREAARLHSYPDWFRFHGTKWHGFRQIGNSVPPLLAKAVAKELIKALKAEPQKDGEPIVPGEDDWLGWNMGQAAKFFAVHPHAIEPRIRRKQ
ncbi:MAG: DNA cytosine methyltransferase [Oscillatoriales cyanobacterium SM2_2_1]|nr:DNA cytosine methyltransferase [Oscillatoriales cyanobacterium SM2_2_1]